MCRRRAKQERKRSSLPARMLMLMIAVFVLWVGLEINNLYVAVSGLVLCAFAVVERKDEEEEQ